nr:polymerase 3 [Influenza C virus]
MSKTFAEIAEAFLEPEAVRIAKEAVEEYGDHERKIIQIGIHFQVCCMFCDEYLSANGNDRFVLIEGRKRGTAVSLQNELCKSYNLEPLPFLCDIFDREEKQFVEIGITRKADDSYFQSKFGKLGNSCKIFVFSYDGRLDKNCEGPMEEQKLRIFSFLATAADFLRKENMFNEIFLPDDEETIIEMKKGKTFLKLRDESVPLPFQTYEQMKDYCEKFKGNPRELASKVSQMQSNIKLPIKHYEQNKFRQIRLPKGPMAPYTHKFLMEEAWMFTKISDPERSRAGEILIDFFKKGNLSAIRPKDKPLQGKYPIHYKNLWNQIKAAIADRTMIINENDHSEFLGGIGRASKKIPEISLTQDIITTEGLKQSENKLPEPRSFPKWFNAEWMWAIKDSDLTGWVPMAEYPPADNELEDYAEHLNKTMEGVLQGTNCAREMGKCILTVGALMTECRLFPGKIKVVPIYARSKERKSMQEGLPVPSEMDCLFGICVKSKSHLSKDDGMYTIITFEFSIREPNLEKHQKYTVFEAGHTTVRMKKGESVIGREVPLYLYCRTTALSKIKNDWLSKARRCFITTMDTVETICLRESAKAEENLVEKTLNEKQMWIGKKNGELIAQPLREALRVQLVQQFYFCIYNDSQLEGFCNEQKKILMALEGDKKNKSSFGFNPEGLLEKIEECLINNPMCLFMAQRLNELVIEASKRGAKFFKTD